MKWTSARLKPAQANIITPVAIAYDLSAFFANILSPLAGNSDFTVTNSAHFASIISSEKIQDNEIMVSFDVGSLFTDVPIEGAVQAARRKLESDPGLADRATLTPAEIGDLLDFVLRSTYFQYNGSIYEQQEGRGARFQRLLLTSTWRRLKNKQ